MIVEKLKLMRHRDSTRTNYYGIWNNFNEFFLKLDEKPDKWEERLVLYVAFLIQNKRKSSTIKSYVSAIKAILFNGGIEIQEDRTLLASLTKACKLNNDIHNNRLPIRKSVIKLLLKALEKKYSATEPYLMIMYRALILSTYYGMFRIGEVTASPHVVKACNVEIGVNKPKLMFVLTSSKTHTKGDKPQIVKISGSSLSTTDKSMCPFNTMQQCLKIRKPYRSDDEQFFVFRDCSPVTPYHYRKLLKKLMKANRLDYTRYGIHGMHAGCSIDLWEMGVSVETIKKLGRWHSTAVYAYLRT